MVWRLRARADTARSDRTTSRDHRGRNPNAGNQSRTLGLHPTGTSSAELAKIQQADFERTDHKSFGLQTGSIIVKPTTISATSAGAIT
jgi:hypothetical protein